MSNNRHSLNPAKASTHSRFQGSKKQQYAEPPKVRPRQQDSRELTFFIEAKPPRANGPMSPNFPHTPHTRNSPGIRPEEFLRARSRVAPRASISTVALQVALGLSRKALLPRVRVG